MTLPALRNLALILALLAVSSPARAQAPEGFVGRPVVSVSLTSDGRSVQDQQARGLIDVTVGKPFSMTSVRSTIAHLMGLGLYLDVRVYARESEGGVAVEVVLVRLQPLRRIVFEGDLGLPERTLQAVVTERFGETLPLGRAADLARVLEDAYHDRGYLLAEVHPRPLDDAAAAAGELICDVQAGPRARIRSITFQGSPDETVASLRATLALEVGSPYSPLELREALDRFAAGLRSTGYFEARAEPLGRPTDAGDEVDLVVSVNRGPLVSVQFRGDQISARLQDEFVPIAREGSADQDLIEDSQLRIEDYFRAQGYRDAKVDTERKEAGGRLTIVFTIAKGAPYRVSSVEILGANSLPEAELRQMVRIAPGDLFVNARLEEGVAALTRFYRLRGFAEADVTAESRRVLVPVPEADAAVPVAVVITVAEGIRTDVGSIAIDGAEAVPEAELRAVLGSTVGGPFYPTLSDSDRERLLALYRNRGYRLARVAPEVAFSQDRRRADLRYVVREGPLVRVGHVLVAGNRRVSDATIRREVTLHPGEPLGDAAVENTQQRLAALGLFRRVTISELPYGPEDQRDVLVTVEKAPSTTIGFGGGVDPGCDFRAHWVAGFQVSGLHAEEPDFRTDLLLDVGREDREGGAMGRRKGAGRERRAMSHANDRGLAAPLAQIRRVDQEDP